MRTYETHLLDLCLGKTTGNSYCNEELLLIAFTAATQTN